MYIMPRANWYNYATPTGLMLIGDEQSLLPATKHELFHEECHHCQDTGGSTFGRLYEPYRHRRIPHLLPCYHLNSRRLELPAKLVINPFLEGSASRDFCQFTVGLLEGGPIRSA
jgi:hypothetical protein